MSHKTLKMGGAERDNNTQMKRRQTSQHFNLQSLPSNKDTPVSIPELYAMHLTLIQHSMASGSQN